MCCRACSNEQFSRQHMKNKAIFFRKLHPQDAWTAVWLSGLVCMYVSIQNCTMWLLALSGTANLYNCKLRIQFSKESIDSCTVICTCTCRCNVIIVDTRFDINLMNWFVFFVVDYIGGFGSISAHHPPTKSSRMQMQPM